MEHDGLESLAPGEPWAERQLDGGPVADLSDDQRALLEGMDDQPAVPRLRDLDPDS
jgi:hypothetical protein